MIQQVNLYKDTLKQRQSRTHPINTYFYGLIAVIFLLIAYSSFLFSGLNTTKNNIQLTKEQLTDIESKILLLSIQHPKQQLNKLLPKEITHSQNKLNNLTQVISQLTDKTSDMTQGFSRYFIALARQSIPQIWLTRININGDQHTIDIKGSTYQAKNTAIFLQKLQNERVFQGRSFAKLLITQSDRSNNQLNFIINTSDELLAKKDHDE